MSSMNCWPNHISSLYPKLSTKKSNKMDPEFVRNGQISVQLYSQSTNHYESMEEVFIWIKRNPNIKEVHCQALVALINEETRRGILMASIAYPKRPTARTIIIADQYKRVKTIEVGVRAVRYFLNKYHDYTIVFSIGTYIHDTCLFIRKSGNRYESVWFNPTVETRVNNVEIFLGHFNMKSCYGYNAPDGNRSGRCSGYVWSTIARFIQSNGQDPFDLNNLLIRNATTKLYT